MRLSVTALALSLAACGGGGGSGGGVGIGTMPAASPAPVAPATEPAPAPAKDCSVDLRGDSIMSGRNLGGKLTATPAERIRQWRPAYTVLTNAEPGTITNSISDFENSHLAARIVVLQWGVIDAGLKLDWEPALRRAVAHVKASGKTPLLTGLVKISPAEGKAIPRKVAADEGVAYAAWDDVEFVQINAHDSHPDQATSDALTQRLVEQLDIIAPECKP